MINFDKIKRWLGMIPCKDTTLIDHGKGTFSFSGRSESSLRGVSYELVKVAREAIRISYVDFIVIEGLRTPARQKELFASGDSGTLNSRHITGHAIDIVALDKRGEVDWKDAALYHKIADAFKKAGSGMNVDIVWGGDWKSRDYGHFELSRKWYP